ncbi:response regulator transcription factor [Streptomyces populi]|uniref:response regulator transcription factor n=1 Tax=Streptomyces populi TaxID=2058924 RepID=UPI0035E249B1
MRPAKPGQPLVEREVQVLKGIASGASYAEIAAELHLAHATVKNYATNLITKLGARSRAHAVQLGHDEGILHRERHGDHAGYAAHLYRGEEACAACKAGERAYRNARRNQQQETAA